MNHYVQALLFQQTQGIQPVTAWVAAILALVTLIFNAGVTWAGFRALHRDSVTKADLKSATLELVIQLQQWTSDNYIPRRECIERHGEREDVEAPPSEHPRRHNHER